jgi:hypothetical protein
MICALLSPVILNQPSSPVENFRVFARIHNELLPLAPQIEQGPILSIQVLGFAVMRERSIFQGSPPSRQIPDVTPYVLALNCEYEITVVLEHASSPGFNSTQIQALAGHVYYILALHCFGIAVTQMCVIVKPRIVIQQVGVRRWNRIGANLKPPIQRMNGHRVLLVLPAVRGVRDLLEPPEKQKQIPSPNSLFT